MAAEDTKALARQFIEEGFNKGNLAVAEAIIAPTFANYDPGTPPLSAGPEGYKQLHRVPHGLSGSPPER